MLDSVTKLITSSQGIALGVVSLLFTVSFIAFLSVVINFLIKRAKGEAGGLKQAGDMLWWSVFAMFIMVAVWGITFFLATNLGVGIGGCAPRPSPIPGQPAINDCGPAGSTGNSGAAANCSSASNRPAGCSCTATSVCKSGSSCSGGTCRVLSNPQTNSTNQSGGKKDPGASCTVLSGGCSNTECVAGYCCIGGSAGQIGTCQLDPNLLN